MRAKALLEILIFSTWLNIIDSGLLQSNQNFSKCNPSKQFSHKNRAGRAKILICAGEKNGVPQWQYTDGSSTLGEVFNPARDCSDIVDRLPGAEDGFYWISSGNKTKHKVKKVWCDVHADGGGFMLVGMKDNPVSWTVPSNSTPVDPQGPAHWSSVLGDSEVLDFGIQFSSNRTFQGTKAHWLYRLKQKRQLGNLFTNDKSKGCGTNNPGIGDVRYVKDVLSGTVMTTNFKCSIFGPHTHPSLGWARMNYCLRHDCKNGYGVIPGPFVFKYTQYGSFSFSAMSSSSGMQRNSTTFVGCDNGKCCACFGPKGGRQNYCGERCTAINGGRIIKKVFVWFWVRSRMPERLWKICMQFMKRNTAGELEKHFIDPRTGTPHKGSCSEQFKTLLNEGTLTVADKGNFEKVPDVPGLLSYREDNKQLYVNEGSEWKALSSKQEVEQLQKKVTRQDKIIQAERNFTKKLEKELQDITARLRNIELPHFSLLFTCTALRQRDPALPSGTYYVTHEGVSFPIYCDMTSKNGVGVTVFGHDSESRTLVNGFEQIQSYRRKINYDASVKQIAAIVDRSQGCKQFIKYECLNSGFYFDPELQPVAASCWVSRQGSTMRNWGGATTNSEKCACAANNGCRFKAGNCNCGLNDNVWTEDSGFLTDKKFLPVTELRFGDTSITLDGHDERDYHTLGKLLCWG